MKIEDNGNKISEKEGYEAMIYMLKSYWELTGSNDLTDILSGGEYIEKDTIGDSAFWEYWIEAIKKVKTKGAPPLKELR